MRLQRLTRIVNAGGVPAPIGGSTPVVVDGTGAALSGAPIVGQRYFIQRANYTNSPTGYFQQWNVGGTAVPSATLDNYVPIDTDVGSVLTVTETPYNGSGTAISGNTSAATSAVADIDLSADAPVLTRTSASGAAPYTSDAALGSKTYAGYTLHRQIASDSGFGTMLYDGQVVLTEAQLQSPLTINWATDGNPAYSDPAPSQFYERMRVEVLTPLGTLKTSPWSATIQKTDGVAAMVLSSTDKTANVTLTNGSLTFNDGGGGGPNTCRASRAINPTQSYWEAKPTNATGTLRIGVADTSATLTAWWSDGVHDSVYDKGGPLSFNGSSSSPASYTTNDVIGFAYDKTANKLWVAKNNTWQNGTPFSSGGLVLTGIDTTTIRPAIEGEFGNVVDFHFTSGTFVYTPPTGASAP